MTIKTSYHRLGTVFVVGIVLALAVVATGAARTSPIVAPLLQDAEVYAIKEAGLQFSIPKGWKVEKQDNGNVVLSFEDGKASVTFVIEDNYADVVTGMKSGLKEKLTDLKADGDAKQDTHNGMTHIEETGSGTMEGVKITWSIDVLKATKNVTILTFGVDKVITAHVDDYVKFVDSIKKI